MPSADGKAFLTVGFVGNKPLLKYLSGCGSLEYNAQRKTIKPLQAAAPFERLADPGNVPPTGRPQMQVPPTAESRRVPPRNSEAPHPPPTAPQRRVSDRKSTPLPPVAPDAFSPHQLTLMNTIMTEHCKALSAGFAGQMKTLQKKVSASETVTADMKTKLESLRKSNTALKSAVTSLAAAPQPQTVSSTPRPCEYL